jgi:hypothetical protein
MKPELCQEKLNICPDQWPVPCNKSQDIASVETFSDTSLAVRRRHPRTGFEPSRLTMGFLDGLLKKYHSDCGSTADNNFEYIPQDDLPAALCEL